MPIALAVSVYALVGVFLIARLDYRKQPKKS